MTRRPLAMPKILGLAGAAVRDWCAHALIEPVRTRPAVPRAMIFISTHRCNARCIMCGIWNDRQGHEFELSADVLGDILTNRLFSRMEYVGISGGEPLLRRDLIDVTRVIVTRCTTLKRLSMTTNGLLVDRLESTVREMATIASDARVLLDVGVSIHGTGETLDEIYGVRDAFATIQRSIRILEKLRDDGRISLSVNCVLLANNVAAARDLGRWADGRRIPISFVVGEQRPRFHTTGLDSAFGEIADGSEIIEFLRELAALPSRSPIKAGRYRELVAILEGRKQRSMSCYYAMGGLVLGHDGQMYYCPHSRSIGSCLEHPADQLYFDERNLDYRRRGLERSECRSCPPYTRTRWEIAADLPRSLIDIARSQTSRIRG